MTEDSRLFDNIKNTIDHSEAPDTQKERAVGLLKEASCVDYSEALGLLVHIPRILSKGVSLMDTGEIEHRMVRALLSDGGVKAAREQLLYDLVLLEGHVDSALIIRGWVRALPEGMTPSLFYYACHMALLDSSFVELWNMEEKGAR